MEKPGQALQQQYRAGGPWHLGISSVARASLPVIRIGNPHGQDARGTLVRAQRIGQHGKQGVAQFSIHEGELMTCLSF